MNVKELDLGELLVAGEAYVKHLDFISSEIRKLEENLKRLHLGAFSYKKNRIELLWNCETKRLCLQRDEFQNLPIRPLLEHKIKERLEAYDILQDFINKMVQQINHKEEG